MCSATLQSQTCNRPVYHQKTINLPFKLPSLRKNTLQLIFLEILDNMCIVIICFPVYDVKILKITAFWWSRFSRWPKKSGQQFKYRKEIKSIFHYFQNQPLRCVLRKRCPENMQQIYGRTPVPKCDFNKVNLQLYWSCILAWVFSEGLLLHV